MGLIFFAVLCGLWLWIAIVDIRHFMIDRLLCLFIVLIFGVYLWVFGTDFWLHFAIGMLYWALAYVLLFIKPRMIGAGDCDLIATCFFVFGVHYLIPGSVLFISASIAVYCYYCWRRGKWGLKRGFPLAVSAALSTVVVTGTIIFEIPMPNFLSYQG